MKRLLASFKRSDSGIGAMQLVAPQCPLDRRCCEFTVGIGGNLDEFNACPHWHEHKLLPHGAMGSMIECGLKHEHENPNP